MERMESHLEELWEVDCVIALKSVFQVFLTAS